MILSTDTQITDKALLEAFQQESIEYACQQVCELTSLPKYTIRIFEWTAKVKDGKIHRADKTLLNYYDLYTPMVNVPNSFTSVKFYQERIEVLRRTNKLQDDQFIEYEVHNISLPSKLSF